MKHRDQTPPETTTDGTELASGTQNNAVHGRRSPSSTSHSLTLLNERKLSMNKNSEIIDPSFNGGETPVPSTESTSQHENNLLAAALQYARAGCAVMPLHSTKHGGCSCGKDSCSSPGKHPRTPHGVKDATTEETTIRKWWTQWRHANIGIATGEGSGLLVLDVDPRHGGDEPLKQLEENHGSIPHTIETITGGNGRHLYFRYPQGAKVANSVGKLGPGLDIRSTGGVVVAPPSKHVSGKTYGWKDGRALGQTALAELPDWLLDRLQVLERNNSPLTITDGKIKEGQRNETLFHAACCLRGRGFEKSAIEVHLQLINQSQCEPPLGEAEITAIAISAAKYPTNALGGQSLTSMSHSLPSLDPTSTAAIAEWVSQKAFFATDRAGNLYVFQNGVYRPNAIKVIKKMVKTFLREQGWSRKWSSHKTKEVAEYLAADAPELWDCPPLDQINVLNGLLHLDTKEFSPHSPDWLSTIQIQVAFDPSAICPKIDAFIQSVLPQDNPSLAYEMAADIVTPDRSLQKAIVLYGAGGNGKSTFLSLLIRFVGEDNVTGMSLHDLEKIRFASARLYGKLANICPDLPTDCLAGTSIFKAITGEDRLVGENKFCPAFEFTPYSRLIFSTNQLPRTRDSSPAFWDRWLVVPFQRTFRGTGRELSRTELDRQLHDPKELSGLLNKVLEVWPSVRQHGFTVSPSMTAALRDYQNEVDPIAEFLSTALRPDPQGMVRKTEVYEAYELFAEQHGQTPLTNGVFWKRAKAWTQGWQGVQRKIDGKTQRVLLGIRLEINSQD